MEIPTMGEWRSWQRVKEDGIVGETIHIGIFIPVGKFGILVIDLSHGLRVLEIVDPNAFVFSGRVVPVALQPAFVQMAMVMLQADQLFQRDARPFFQQAKSAL